MQFFDTESWSVSYVMRQIVMEVQSWKNWAAPDQQRSRNMEAQRARPPSNPHHAGFKIVTLQVDGSWNAHSQQMACGALLLDATACWISGLSSSFGIGTSIQHSQRSLKHLR